MAADPARSAFGGVTSIPDAQALCDGVAAEYDAHPHHALVAQHLVAGLAIPEFLEVGVDGVPQLSVPKSERGRRTIDLDQRTLEALKLHRERQLDERRRWGDSCHDLDLITAREDGMWVHPDWLSGLSGNHVKAAQLRPIPLKNLWHTHASLLLEAGVNPKVVSERLGHHSVAFTLDTYAHVLPGLQAQAAEDLSDLVFGSHAEGDDDEASGDAS